MSSALRSSHRIAALAALLVAACFSAVGAAEPDSAAVQYFAPGGLSKWSLAPYSDLRLRAERVHDRPGASDDLELQRMIVRAGLAWAPTTVLRVEAGARLIAGSDGKNDPWAPVLNEPAEDVALDRLGLRIATPSGSLTVALGKQRSPLRLTEMIWDDDLRPVGIAGIARRDLGRDRSARLAFALLARSRFDADDARLGAAQLTAMLGEGAASGAEASVAWLSTEGPEDLARDKLQRQNAAVASARRLDYVVEFDVVDLQLGARTLAGGIPVAARVDLARNVAIERDHDGLRLRLALGGASMPAGAEVGWVFQRIEREAVAGAFNSDDWWFHSRMRGHQVWLRASRGERLEARIAFFHERRDDLSRATRRSTLEITARWP